MNLKFDLKALDQITMCGCLLHRLTKQCLLKPHLALGERKKHKTDDNDLSLTEPKEEKQPNY